jgi:hypothetical protein
MSADRARPLDRLACALFAEETTNQRERRHMKERRISRPLLLSIAGLATGLAVGTAVVAVTATAGLLDASSPAQIRDARSSRLLATHLPPLLPLAGEPVELRYDLYCDHGEADVDSPCDGGGTVFVRPGAEGAFRSIPLEVDASADAGGYVARVPGDLTASPTGFQYYAVLRDDSTGETTTVPEGGAAAPQWSHPLSRPVTVDLGTHVFGATRARTERVASASWGSGPAEVGLEGGKQETPIGGSSFDVDSDGTVTLLDEVNHRALRFAQRRDPVAVPLDVSGREADMSIEPGGAIDVLEPPGADQPEPRLERFGPNGGVASSAKLADPFASSVRVVRGAPVVLEYPSSQWIPVLTGEGAANGASSAEVRASAGLAEPDGQEAIVYRTGSEVRVALISNGLVRRSWRVLSSTPLAEVQLARTVGENVVLVVRVYTDSADEFEVLVLGDQRPVDRFSVEAADWAETAPLARFRLVGSSLYQLGSTAGGPFVDRYALGVR